MRAQQAKCVAQLATDMRAQRVRRKWQECERSEQEGNAMNASGARQMENLVACEQDENGMDASAASKENDKNASAVSKKKMVWMRAQRAICKIWWHASAASKAKMARRKWYGCECSEPDLKCQKEFQRHASAASKTKMVWTRAERAR